MSSTEIFLEYMAYRKRVNPFVRRAFTFAEYREFVAKEWALAQV